MDDINGLAEAIFKGDRVALGKAITLVESNHPEHRKTANNLLKKVLPKTGNSLRIGITGVPGVGKSTFIEAFGEEIINSGKSVAVLAIDPSSPQSKGSILGDKTRMEKLASNPGAFIRPSAASGQLGGVANKTMEAILLCEAAGYEIILVETVGVGQSEIAVKNMTDVFLLMMLAGAGDELQGIKRGIMEMADILVINKADGDNLKAAMLAKKTYENALHLLAPKESGWSTPVCTASALHGDGVSEVLSEVLKLRDYLLVKELFEANRKRQKKHWFNEILGMEMMARLKADAKVKSELSDLETAVLNDRTTPYQASEEIIKKLFSSN